MREGFLWGGERLTDDVGAELSGGETWVAFLTWHFGLDVADRGKIDEMERVL